MPGKIKSYYENSSGFLPSHGMYSKMYYTCIWWFSYELLDLHFVFDAEDLVPAVPGRAHTTVTKVLNFKNIMYSRWGLKNINASFGQAPVAKRFNEHLEFNFSRLILLKLQRIFSLVCCSEQRYIFFVPFVLICYKLQYAVLSKIYVHKV